MGRYEIIVSLPINSHFLLCSGSVHVCPISAKFHVKLEELLGQHRSISCRYMCVGQSLARTRSISHSSSGDVL